MVVVGCGQRALQYLGACDAWCFDSQQQEVLVLCNF
jgi:hypothetical protein